MKEVVRKEVKKETENDSKQDSFWKQLNYMPREEYFKKPKNNSALIKAKFLLGIPLEGADFYPDDTKYFWGLICCSYCEEEHLPGVMELDREAFSDPWSLETWQRELKMRNPVSIWVVAEVEGHIAGYAGIWVAAGEAQLMRIAVRKELRNMGVGRLLLDRLVGEAEMENATAMTLEVRESNVAARKFYEHYGFVSSGIRPGYYSNPSEGAVIMWMNFPAEDLAELMKYKGCNKDIPVT